MSLKETRVEGKKKERGIRELSNQLNATRKNRHECIVGLVLCGIPGGGGMLLKC